MKLFFANSPSRLTRTQRIAALVLGLMTPWCWGQAALSESAAASAATPSVVVVLAGGGAKGFAHLAVLRQLERDHIPIARIVGTSMGAVVGGLYASGMSTDDIERMVGGLDPSKVALDQLNRLELPSRTRAYQQKYPVDLEFGIKDGRVSFARGVSDGQRFLALLQALTAHVPPNVHFNDLKIPFRAVATRYRDGEMKVFDQGALHLAIRASMAAPAGPNAPESPVAEGSEHSQAEAAQSQLDDAQGSGGGQDLHAEFGAMATQGQAQDDQQQAQDENPQGLDPPSGPG